MVRKGVTTCKAKALTHFRLPAVKKFLKCGPASDALSIHVYILIPQVPVNSFSENISDKDRGVALLWMPCIFFF